MRRLRTQITGGDAKKEPSFALYLVEWFVERRLRRLDANAAARLAYHDRATLAVVANFGLSTQLAVLGVCLAVHAPEAYLWVAIGCGAALVPLQLRREWRVRA